MNLLVRRCWPDTLSTIGMFYINGVFECFTLEDPVREVPGQPVESWKIKGHTAIPVGTYKVTIDMSTRFGREMPHVLDVPGFLGIRIHPGNSAADTEGCILLGLYRVRDYITHSRDAFDKFFPKLQAAIDKQEAVTITVEKAYT